MSVSLFSGRLPSLFIVGALTWMALSSARGASETASRAACVASERTIDHAIMAFEAEHDSIGLLEPLPERDAGETATLRPQDRTWRVLGLDPRQDCAFLLDERGAHADCGCAGATEGEVVASGDMLALRDLH